MALLNLSILPEPKEQPSAAAPGSHARGGAHANGNDGFRSILTAAIETNGRQSFAIDEAPQGGVPSTDTSTDPQNGLTPLPAGGEWLVGGRPGAFACPKEVARDGAVGRDYAFSAGAGEMRLDLLVAPGAGEPTAASGGGAASGAPGGVLWSGIVQVGSGVMPGELLFAGPEASGQASVTPMPGRTAGGGEDISTRACGGLSGSLQEAQALAVLPGLEAHPVEEIAQDTAMGVDSLNRGLAKASDESGGSYDGYRESSSPAASPTGGGKPSDGTSDVLAQAQASYYAGSIAGPLDDRWSAGEKRAGERQGALIEPVRMMPINPDGSGDGTGGGHELRSADMSGTATRHRVEVEPDSDTAIQADAVSGTGGEDRLRSTDGGRTTAGYGVAVFPGVDHPIDRDAGGAGGGGEWGAIGRPGKGEVPDMGNAKQDSIGRAAVIGTTGIAPQPLGSVSAAFSNPPKGERSSPLPSRPLDVAPARLVRQETGTSEGELTGEGNQPANGALTTGRWSGISGENVAVAAAYSPVTRSAAPTKADESVTSRTPGTRAIRSTVGVGIAPPDGYQGAGPEGVSAHSAVIWEGGAPEQGTASQWRDTPFLGEEPESRGVAAGSADKDYSDYRARAGQVPGGGQQAIGIKGTEERELPGGAFGQVGTRAQDGPGQMVGDPTVAAAKVAGRLPSNMSTPLSGQVTLGLRDAEIMVHSDRSVYSERPGMSPLPSRMTAGGRMSAGDAPVRAAVGEATGTHTGRDNAPTQAPPTSATVPSPVSGTRQGMSELRSLGLLPNPAHSVDLTVAGGRTLMGTLPAATVPGAAPAGGQLAGTAVSMQVSVKGPDVHLRMAGRDVLPAAVSEDSPGDDAGWQSASSGADADAAGADQALKNGNEGRGPVISALPGGSGRPAQASGLNSGLAGSQDWPLPASSVAPGMLVAGDPGTEDRSLDYLPGVPPQSLTSAPPIVAPGMSVAGDPGTEDRLLDYLPGVPPQSLTPAPPIVAPGMSVAGDPGTEDRSLDYLPGVPPQSLNPAPPMASDSADYRLSPKTRPLGSTFVTSTSGMQRGQMAGPMSTLDDHVALDEAALKSSAARLASAADSSVWNGRLAQSGGIAVTDGPVAATVAAGGTVRTDGVGAADKSTSPMDRSSAAETQMQRQTVAGGPGIALEVHKSVGGVMTSGGQRAGQGGQSVEAPHASDQMVTVRIEEKSERASAGTTRIERGRTFGLESGPAVLEEQKGWKSPAAALVAQGSAERKRWFDAAPNGQGEPGEKSFGTTQAIQTAGQSNSERQGRPDTQAQSHTGRKTEPVFGAGAASVSNGAISGQHVAATPPPIVGEQVAGATHSVAMLQQGARTSVGDVAPSHGALPALARPPEFPEPTDLIPQIVRSAVLSSQRGGSSITLRLDPPELGALRMRLTSDAGGVSASIAVERPDLKQSIESNLHQLRTALNDCGVQIHTLIVTVGDDLRQGQSRPDHPYRPHLPDNPPHPDRNARDDRQEGRRPSPRRLDYRTVDYFA